MFPTTKPEQTRQTWLLVLLITNVIASILHYTDNLIHFDAYPEPDWFSPYLTDSIWLVMTPIGIAGYFLYRQRKFYSAYLALLTYFVLSQFTLGHYLVAPIWELTTKMNFLILLESLIAYPILFFVLISQFIWQEVKE